MVRFEELVLDGIATEGSSEFVFSDFTIIERLRHHATMRPGASAYTFLREGGEAESLTFRQLEERTKALALTLSKRAGVGERALLLYPSGLEFVTAFLACLYAGIIAVPATTPRKNRSANRLQAIFDDATPKLILTTSDIASTVRRAFPDVTGIIPTDTLDVTSEEEGEDLPELRPETVAFLQYTSGSTGTPKGVIVTHENLARNALTLQEGLELSEESVNVGWLPLFHDMGLIGNVLTSLYVGFPCVLMSPGTFLQRPLTWLQAITKYRATMVGAPNFGWDYCARLIKEEEKEALDLSSIVTAYNGSEPVRADTMNDFYKAFARQGFNQESFFPCYGLAESTLFVSGGPSTRLPRVIEVDAATLEQNIVAAPASGDAQTHKLVGCGRAWLDTLAEIVNPETGERCANGRIGEVWVSGGSIAAGY